MRSSPQAPRGIGMRKTLLALLLCVTAAVGAAEARPLLLVSTENPAEHVQTRIVQRFVERLRACCADRLDVDYRYGAQIFRDRDVLGALSQGKVGMALPGTWQFDRTVPDMGVFMLPVFYGRSDEDAHRIQDGPIVDALSQQIEERLDVVMLGRWLALGPANLFTTSQPLRDVADLRGLRIRSPGGLANEWRLDAQGAKPVTIAWSDLVHALGDGRVDGLVTTFATLDSANLWTRGIRYALEDHQSFSFYVPLVSGYVWRSLDAETRRALRAAWEAGVDDARAELQAAQTKARERARAAGVRIATPTEERTAEVRAQLIDRQLDIAQRVGVDASIIDGLAASLGDFR